MTETFRNGTVPVTWDTDKHSQRLFRISIWSVHLATYDVHVSFLLYEMLAAVVIPGENVCDRLIRTIRAIDKTVQLEHGMTNLILRNGHLVQRKTRWQDAESWITHDKVDNVPPSLIRALATIDVTAQNQVWIFLHLKFQHLVVVQPKTRLFKSINSVVQMELPRYSQKKVLDAER